MSGKIPNHRIVELVGGPLDGHQCTVPWRPADMPCHIFRTREPDGRLGCYAYAQSERVTRNGRWALGFLLGVGKTATGKEPPHGQ
jgi:hypothetical protein